MRRALDSGLRRRRAARRLAAPATGNASRSAMEAHVAALCLLHSIEREGESRNGRAIRYRGGKLAARLPEVRGQVSYFVCLHEIGHLIGSGRSAPRLESEANAWAWALQNAVVEPTDATRRSIGKRLRGYLDWAESRQYRRVPPRIPGRDHLFWRLLRWEGAAGS